MKNLFIRFLPFVAALFVALPSYADDAATVAMLRAENLGGLRLEMPEKEVIKLLGQPAERGKMYHQEADGNHIEDWLYPAKGIELAMSAGTKKTGAKSVARIMASAPCKLATKAGIKVGSAESAVRKVYAAHEEGPSDRGTFIAGSIYGGIIFTFEEGKVSSIFFGAGAE